MQVSLFKLADEVNILPFDGEVLFYPHFLSPQESNEYFDYMLQTLPWKQDKIRIYDKEVLQPRLTAYYGDTNKNLSYSGTTMHPNPWTEQLTVLKLKTETIAGVSFTNALFNLYRDGKDSVSWHRDNEKYLGVNPIIGSVSLGATRTFQFRYYKDKSIVRSIELTAGSLLIMRGTTQHFWEHQVPKTNKRIGARINITFRIIK
jgi:alkylated DNA repair dioxygenase AlkB